MNNQKLPTNIDAVGVKIPQNTGFPFLRLFGIKPIF